MNEFWLYVSENSLKVHNLILFVIQKGITPTGFTFFDLKILFSTLRSFNYEKFFSKKTKLMLLKFKYFMLLYSERHQKC
jgi:hypothetical protein